MKKKVLIISGVSMGQDHEIGKKLLMACIHTLNDIEEKPKFIILYNSGVTIFENEQIKADLQALINLGVEIICCTTCLKYFSIDDYLGRATNMLEIMEIMSKNDLIYV